MDTTLPVGGSNSATTIRWVFAIAFVGLLFYSARLVRTTSQPKEQTEYENWLNVATVQLRHDQNPEVLPVLSLKIMGEEPDSVLREMKILPSQDMERRAHSLRLLEILREADLFSLKRPNDAVPQPGDIVLAVTSPEKGFTLIVPQQAIRDNVKANLLLKLFDEYSKLPASDLIKAMLKREPTIEEQLKNAVISDNQMPVDPSLLEGGLNEE